MHDTDSNASYCRSRSYWISVGTVGFIRTLVHSTNSAWHAEQHVTGEVGEPGASSTVGMGRAHR